jgi:hypothetical protein
LGHQPIDGATYTAAKVTHLVRIVLYLVPAMNVFPALAGLTLKEATWSYPLRHVVAALGVGFIAALLCCAFYGWLIRIVPARRLKAAAQFSATIPLLLMMSLRPIRDLAARFNVAERLPSQPGVRWALSLACGAAAVAIAVVGIRSLSADRLMRVSSMAHGRSSDRARAPGTWAGKIVGRLFGGQAARAGFAYVCQLARRDYQFLRQAIPVLFAVLLGSAPLIANCWRIDPFSGRFTTAHLLPHLLGIAIVLLCGLLAYGSDFKAAWIFLLAPAQAFRGFAFGVYAAVCIVMIAVPHAMMLLLAWPWGIWRTGLFTAYSAAICSVYLAVALRLIDGAPFSKQANPARGAGSLLGLLSAGVAAAIAAGLQYFFIFRSPAIAATVTAATGAASWLLTRSSLGALEVSIRYNLALLSTEPGTLYEEIEV